MSKALPQEKRRCRRSLGVQASVCSTALMHRVGDESTGVGGKKELSAVMVQRHRQDVASSAHLLPLQGRQRDPGDGEGEGGRLVGGRDGGGGDGGGGVDGGGRVGGA
ncbi:hypothetical protein EYF80_044320 [Liparis tanakae]|uniref:Uncharacterized protein n=1 Tax=Liparis tanakae TaxID=230148 RepID=A0A4Z2FWZ5_9TELE|nr:hypothetical protein EYF80_044320 [Liparis tanakae]